MNRIDKWVLFSAMLLAVGVFVAAGPGSEDELYEEWLRMRDSKSEVLKEFNEAKFGMFIHWGVYSHLGGVWKGERMEDGGVGPRVAEWIMRRKSIPRDEYAEVAAQFNPVRFDADEWAQIAADAGMRYMIITSKHHDGFALYDSGVSDWNIVDATPFKRDVIKELHDACRRKGIRFGVYYSHGLDWWDGGDYGGKQYAAQSTGLRKIGANDWDPSPLSFDEYLSSKALPQVTELAQRHPDLFAFWFDGGGYMPESRSFDFYKSIYEQSTGILIQSRISNPDLSRHLGDYQSAGDNHIPGKEDINSQYWETCGTLNNSWGYKSYDHDWKQPLEVLSWLLDITSRGGNYLLNVGPKGDGTIPAESVAILRKVGDWMEVNGDAIYGTRAWYVSREGPTVVTRMGTNKREQEGFKAKFTAEDFWFTTRGNSVFVMALVKPEDGVVLVKSIRDLPVQNVRLLGSAKAPVWQMTPEGLKIKLPGESPSTFGYALEVVSK